MKRKYRIVLAAIIASLLFVVACEKKEEPVKFKVGADFVKLREFINNFPPDNPPKTLQLICTKVNGQIYCEPED